MHILLQFLSILGFPLGGSVVNLTQKGYSKRYDLSFRTSDRCHWCGNPHSLSPKRGRIATTSVRAGFAMTYF